jgi:hypothetical protein
MPLSIQYDDLPVFFIETPAGRQGIPAGQNAAVHLLKQLHLITDIHTCNGSANTKAPPTKEFCALLHRGPVPEILDALQDYGFCELLHAFCLLSCPQRLLSAFFAILPRYRFHYI